MGFLDFLKKKKKPEPSGGIDAEVRATIELSEPKAKPHHKKARKAARHKAKPRRKKAK